jgi:hypothetical protein
MLIAASQSSELQLHPLVVVKVKGFGLPYQDPQPALWLYSLKITHPATKGLGRVKVFVNTAAHEEITLHLPLRAGTCVFHRPPAEQSTCQSGARSTASGSRPSVGVPPAETRAAGAATGSHAVAIF